MKITFSHIWNAVWVVTFIGFGTILFTTNSLPIAGSFLAVGMAFLLGTMFII